MVKEKRLGLGLSQSALGQAVGVDAQTISNFETGKTKGFKISISAAVADALKVPDSERSSFIQAITEKRMVAKKRGPAADQRPGSPL